MILSSASCALALTSAPLPDAALTASRAGTAPASRHAFRWDAAHTFAGGWRNFQMWQRGGGDTHFEERECVSERVGGWGVCGSAVMLLLKRPTYAFTHRLTTQC